MDLSTEGYPNELPIRDPEIPQEFFEYPNNLSILEVMNEEYRHEFLELPTEMMNYLNSFLNYQDTRRFAQTCKFVNDYSQSSIKGKREQLKKLFYNCCASPLGTHARNMLQNYLTDNQKFDVKNSANLGTLKQYYFEKISEKRAPKEGDNRVFIFMPNVYFETADNINQRLSQEAMALFDAGTQRYTCICGFQIHMIESHRFGGAYGTIIRHFSSDIHLQRLFAYNYTLLGEALNLSFPYGTEEHRFTNMDQYVYPQGYLSLNV